MKSPFKFLDAYTKEDREIFFGRDREIEEMYQKVFESKILLVYGISGTGKTSLIDCGLANKFEESDWLPVTVRRAGSIVESLVRELEKAAISPINIDAGKIVKGLQSIYLDHFKPIYLIFDQFEELFIFGDREEREEFIQIIKAITDSEVKCKFIFSIREEYLASVTEFELTISDFLSNRMRIEKMTHQHAIEAIEGPCRVNGIEVQEGFSEKLLNKMNPHGKDVELTYLQVFLDKIYKLAIQKSQGPQTQNPESGTRNEKQSVKGIKHRVVFLHQLLDEVGDVSDLLGSFLEEQISGLDNPDTGLIVLKAFVSMQGTKKQIGLQEIGDFARTLGSPIEDKTLTELLQKFVNLRVLREKDENDRYELRHDSLATKIYEKITLVEKELLEIKDFLDNAFMNHERRGVHLSEADLKYIAPYEDKLFLNKKQNQLITESRNIIERARTRRRRTLGIAASAIILVLSVFTIWAVIERSKATRALKEKELAEAKLDEAAKNFVMSAENLNILYKGIENPISFAIPGKPQGHFFFGADLPLYLVADEYGIIITPYETGIANIDLWRVVDDDTIKLGSRSFRVMALPDPVPMINGKNGGYILRDELAEMSGIDFVIRDFNYDYDFKVIGYTVSFSVGDGSYIHGIGNNEIPEMVRDLFRRLNHNSSVHFTDIRVEGPDDIIRNLGSLTLTVVRWLDYGNERIFYSLVEQSIQNRDFVALGELTKENIKKYYWDNPGVLNNVAYEYYRLIDYFKIYDELGYLESLDWSARSVELSPNDPDYLDTYASLLYKFRRFDEAELNIRKAIRIARENNEPTESYESLLNRILETKSNYLELQSD